MDEAESKLARLMGFHLIDGSDSLAQTHWLVLNPPEGLELDDHPPEGPEDRFFEKPHIIGSPNIMLWFAGTIGATRKQPF